MTKYLPTSTPGSMENLLDVWRRADHDQRTAGAAWYATAHNELCAIAAEFGVATETAVAVAAVLSPSLAWDANLIATRELLAGHTVRGYGMNVTKAKAIVAGKSPEAVLSGPKVWAFYNHLLTPNATWPAVVDRHMLRAWAGFSDPGAYSCSETTYNRVTADIAAAAEFVGQPVGAFQATVWLQIREEAR